METLFFTQEDIVQLIIDSRKFSYLFDDIGIVFKIEKVSINLCYKLYSKGSSRLRKMEDGCEGCTT